MELTREHELLEHLVAHPAWELVKATIKDTVKIYYNELLDPSQGRKNRLPDDYIRGAIRALRDLVEWPEIELKAAYHEVETENTRVREMREDVPLFGGERLAPEGEVHGRTENGSGNS